MSMSRTASSRAAWKRSNIGTRRTCHCTSSARSTAASRLSNPDERLTGRAYAPAPANAPHSRRLLPGDRFTNAENFGDVDKALTYLHGCAHKAGLAFDEPEAYAMIRQLRELR
jgi:hypothetical protein